MNALNRNFIAVIAGVVAFAATASAQVNVVVGTGDPNIDVPAVQAAVDQGGRVVLMGHFSFDRPPTKPAGVTYGGPQTRVATLGVSGSYLSGHCYSDLLVRPQG